MALANYVKFRRGTQAMFDSLATKDADCLYFISEKNATSGLLYLGDKLISGDITANTAISKLEDVLLGADVPTNSMLVYDASLEKWLDKPFSQIFEEITQSLILITMTGATANRDGAVGVVPKPKAGEQDMVLKGNGTWGEVSRLSADREQELAKVRTDLNTLIGDDKQLSVRIVAAQEVDKIVAGARSDLDTLNKISGWITGQENTTAVINTHIVNIQNHIGNLDDEIERLKNKDLDLQEQIYELDDRLQWRNVDNPY